MSYVYIRSESQLWTVGFYQPNGRFESESDHGSPEEAAERVRFLNGGNPGIQFDARKIEPARILEILLSYQAKMNEELIDWIKKNQ